MLLRRLKKWVKPAAWATFVLLVVGVGLFAARGVAPGSTIAGMRERLGGSSGFAGLRVAHVDIQGRANTPEALLRAAIGVAEGDPILGFSVEAARARIESLTWVEQATVERRLPDTVVIALKERRPFAIWQNQKKYVLIDRAGQVVANQDVALFKDKLPMVVGPGAPIAANALLTTLEKYPSLSGRILAAVRVGERFRWPIGQVLVIGLGLGERRWDLHLKNGIDVMLPEGHEAEALERLLQLHQEHALMDRPLVAIDLRLPDRLVVRPRPDSGTTQTGAAGPSAVPPPPPSPPAAIQAAAKRPT